MGLFGCYHSIRAGFEARFAAQYIGVVGIGLGSAAFHGTLQHLSQQSDETPMVISILIWFYLLYEPILCGEPHRRRWQPVLAVVLFVYCAVFAVVHFQYRFTVAFQLHFMGWVLLCAAQLYRYYSACDEESARVLARIYLQSLLIGFACWVFDYHLCEWVLSATINPHGHAWWHLFMGMNAYIGPVFVQYVRARQLGWQPEVHYRFACIPYISVMKNRKNP